jgi:colicin import membrane protein
MIEQPAVTATCRYPGCEESPERPSGKPGRPPEYCAHPGHDRVSAWRERRRLAAEDAGLTTSDADTEQPVTMARVSGAQLVRDASLTADRLAGIADRLYEAVATGLDDHGLVYSP